MGCCRASRESEKRLAELFPVFMGLSNCVWYGKSMLEDVEENVEVIKKGLDEVVRLMREEE